MQTLVESSLHHSLVLQVEYEKVNVHPAAMKKAMHQFIRNRPNWCISRQRKWGLPIPVLYYGDDRVKVDSDFINHIAQRVGNEGSDFWFSEQVDQIVPRPLVDKVMRKLNIPRK